MKIFTRKIIQEETRSRKSKRKLFGQPDYHNIGPPEKPPIQLLRIPANSSATSFVQAMVDTGNLLIFETEGDTVVNIFNSDSLRKAFAHESFGYLRRGDDGEEKEIDNPRLSAVLSGTPEQVKSLIRDAENGLLSRFMFFCKNDLKGDRSNFTSKKSKVLKTGVMDSI